MPSPRNSAPRDLASASIMASASSQPRYNTDVSPRSNSSPLNRQDASRSSESSTSSDSMPSRDTVTPPSLSRGFGTSPPLQESHFSRFHHDLYDDSQRIRGYDDDDEYESTLSRIWSSVSESIRRRLPRIPFLSSRPRSDDSDDYMTCASEESLASLHKESKFKQMWRQSTVGQIISRNSPTGSPFSPTGATPMSPGGAPRSLASLPTHTTKQESRWYFFFGHALFSIFYLFQSIKSSLRIYLTSLISLILSVVIICVLYQTIQKSNLVFLYLAESNAGEMDFIWQRRLMNASEGVFLNLTDVERAMQANTPLTESHQQILGNIGDKSAYDYIKGISSRWLIPGFISHTENTNFNSSALFLIMDTDKESEIGIGRNWDHRPLGVQEVHVRDTLLSAVDVIPDRGQEVELGLNLMGILSILNGENLEVNQDEGEHDATPDVANEAQALHNILERAGFNFTQQFRFNVTEILEDQQIPIPPELKPFIDIFGIIDVTGEQLFQFFLNSTRTPQSLGAPFRVVDAFGGADGLYPSALGNVVILDSKYVPQIIRRTIRGSPLAQFLIAALNAQEQVDTFLSTFRITDFSMTIVGQLKDRFAIYEKGKDPRDAEFVRLTNGVKAVLGVDYPINQQFPLVSVMDLSNFLSLFLDQIFNTVLVILGILSAILINMLLMSNIEDHIYEYGMIRALGLDKPTLAGIVLSYSLLFAIPGIIIGLIVAFVINVGVEALLSWYISLPHIDISMSAGALIIPTVVGLAVPLVANILPARKAMSRSLRDALDLTFQTFNQTKVTMIRLERIGIELWQTVVSIFLVVAGFVVYYMIPYAFIFQDFGLFFFILNSILLGMKIGMCLVAAVLQPILERIILFFILIGKDRRMKNLIEKNLAGHRKRSRQTFIMFTIATAFVIFAGVSFSLQTSAIVQNAESIIGTDVVVMSSTERYPLPEAQLSEYMDLMKAKNLVEDYAYVSFRMRSNNLVSTNRFSALSGFPSNLLQMHGVTENFLRVSKSSYFLSTDIDDKFEYQRLRDGKPDIVHSLFADAGKARVAGEVPGYHPQIAFSAMAIGYPHPNITFDPTRAYASYLDAIVSTATKEPLSTSINHPALITLTVKKPKGPSLLMPILVKPKAFVYKFPGFVFSSYSVSARNSPMILSSKEYVRLTKSIADFVQFKPEDPRDLDFMPKQRLLIRMREGTTEHDETVVLNGLRSQLDAELALVQSVRDVVNSTATAKSILNWAFNLLAFLACLLCFLNLTTAFTANVKDNQWIYGVLRALGMSGFQLTRAYIYEALCLVLSAFGCGTIIGTLIALTLVVQQNLFLQNPLVFDFPWILFCFLLVMAVGLAVLGSWIPTRTLQKKDIAFVLRGL